MPEQIEDANIVVADVAEAIVRLADAADKMMAEGLTEDAAVILLAEKSGVNRKEVRAVLRSLPKLREYVK